MPPDNRAPNPALPYVIGGLVVAFVVLAAAVTNPGGPWWLDAPLLLTVPPLRSEGLSQTVRFVTHLGGVGPMSIAGLALAIFAAVKKRRAAVFVVVALAGSALINYELKQLFQRARPTLIPALVTNPGGSSFPSGHSQASMAFAFTLVLLAWRSSRLDRWLLSAFLFPALVGASRVYLGVHYPSDVIAGWFAGAAVVMLAHLLVKPGA